MENQHDSESADFEYHYNDPDKFQPLRKHPYITSFAEIYDSTTPIDLRICDATPEDVLLRIIAARILVLAEEQRGTSQELTNEYLGSFLGQVDQLLHRLTPDNNTLTSAIYPPTQQEAHLDHETIMKRVHDRLHLCQKALDCNDPQLCMSILWNRYLTVPRNQNREGDEIQLGELRSDRDDDEANQTCLMANSAYEKVIFWLPTDLVKINEMVDAYRLRVLADIPEGFCETIPRGILEGYSNRNLREEALELYTELIQEDIYAIVRNTESNNEGFHSLEELHACLAKWMNNLTARHHDPNFRHADLFPPVEKGSIHFYCQADITEVLAYLGNVCDMVRTAQTSIGIQFSDALEEFTLQHRTGEQFELDHHMVLGFIMANQGL